MFTPYNYRAVSRDSQVVDNFAPVFECDAFYYAEFCRGKMQLYNCMLNQNF